MRHFKIILFLLISAAALAISWFVSFALFLIVAMSVVLISTGVLLSVDTWRQTREADRSPPSAMTAGGTTAGVMTARVREPGKPRRAADARGRRRAETLRPDATVTFSEERRASGADEVFATLDDQLVGLVP